MSKPITVVSSMAVRQVLTEAANRFQLKHAYAVEVTPMGGVDVAKALRGGARFDVVVLARDALNALASETLAVATSIVTIALSPTALAVRAGEIKPRFHDAQSLRASLAGVRSIGVSTGPSGQQVCRLLADMTGDGDVVKLVEAPPGVPVAQLIRDGRADIGFQQLSELLGQPGIDIVGAAPHALIPHTAFAAGLCDEGRADDNAARDFLAYCCSNDFASILRRHGMEPPASGPHHAH